MLLILSFRRRVDITSGDVVLPETRLNRTATKEQGVWHNRRAQDTTALIDADQPEVSKGILEAWQRRRSTYPLPSTTAEEGRYPRNTSPADLNSSVESW